MSTKVRLRRPMPPEQNEPRKSARIVSKVHTEPIVPNSEDVAEMGRTMLDRLCTVRDARDDELLCEPFLKLPSRKQYPEYYVVIRRPISFAEIRLKLKQREYGTFLELKQDLELMCNNAKRFNMSESDIYLKARDLHGLIKDISATVFEEWQAQATAPASPNDEATPVRPHKITLRRPVEKAQLQESPPSIPTTPTPASAPSVPVTPSPLRVPIMPVSTTAASYVIEPRRRGAPRGKRLKVMLRWAVQNMMAAQDMDGHTYSDMFLELPSRDEYPDYYQFIQRPICFRDIERKLDMKEYINPHALVSDIRLMLSNAQFYNEEKSQVWNDAQALWRHLDRVLVPALLAEGFTLDPNDHRQAAVPPGKPGYVPPPTPTTSSPSTQPAQPPMVRPAPSAPTAASPAVSAPSTTSAPVTPATPAGSVVPVVPPAPSVTAVPAPAVPANVSLERVWEDLQAKVWPRHPATFSVAPTCAAESRDAQPCPWTALHVTTSADAHISVRLEASQHHILTLPRGTHATSWHWDGMTSEEEAARILVRNEPVPITREGPALTHITHLDHGEVQAQQAHGTAVHVYMHTV